jgi:hypothetical protein
MNNEQGRNAPNNQGESDRDKCNVKKEKKMRNAQNMIHMYNVLTCFNVKD